MTARSRYVAPGERDSRRCLDVTLLDEGPYRKAGDEGCPKVRKKLETVPPSIPAARAAPPWRSPVPSAAIANANRVRGSSVQGAKTRCVR